MSHDSSFNNRPTAQNKTKTITDTNVLQHIMKTQKKSDIEKKSDTIST